MTAFFFVFTFSSLFDGFFCRTCYECDLTVICSAGIALNNLCKILARCSSHVENKQMPQFHSFFVSFKVG